MWPSRAVETKHGFSIMHFCLDSLGGNFRYTPLASVWYFWFKVLKLLENWKNYDLHFFNCWNKTQLPLGYFLILTKSNQKVIIYENMFSHNLISVIYFLLMLFDSPCMWFRLSLMLFFVGILSGKHLCQTTSCLIIDHDTLR